MSGFEWAGDIPRSSDPSILEGYLVDASNMLGNCEIVFRPRDATDISQILRECSLRNTGVTVTAQRTATTGAPIPNGGVLLSMENINQIHSVSEVDAGVILGQYQEFIEPQGLLFPPDPTSKNSCSIGGAISSNASGARSFRYGSIRNWVDAVEVVLPTGEIWQIDRETPIPKGWSQVGCDVPNVKTSAGYELGSGLLDLMIGQEGTLCVITKAWLSTIDTPSIIGMMVCFYNRRDCLEAVELLKRPCTLNGNIYRPLSIEYFDSASIQFMHKRVDGIPNARCGLFIELDCDSGSFPHLSHYLDGLMRCGADMDNAILADNDIENRRLKSARHAIPSGINELVVANGMPKLGTDFAVPSTYLEWMMDAYEEVTVPSVLFGHIGDNHLHLNMLPRDSRELAIAKQSYIELARIAMTYGGTVSAEHGIGKIKKHLLAEMLGDDVIEQFRSLKSVVDPGWILGRGTLFDRLV